MSTPSTPSTPEEPAGSPRPAQEGTTSGGAGVHQAGHAQHTAHGDPHVRLPEGASDGTQPQRREIGPLRSLVWLWLVRRKRGVAAAALLLAGVAAAVARARAKRP